MRSPMEERTPALSWRIPSERGGHRGRLSELPGYLEATIHHFGTDVETEAPAVSGTDGRPGFS